MTAQSMPTEVSPFDLPGLCRYFSEWSPQPMVAVEGPTHVVRYLNPAFASLAGSRPDEMVGRPFDVGPDRVGGACMAVLDRVFRTGKPENLAEQEHRRTPPTYWSYAMWAILGAGGRPAGVMIQVTEATEAAVFRERARAMNEALVVSSVRQHELIDAIRRGEQDRLELERQMFQAQKLESLGVLAGGIAHDLNNMLTPVIGFAELAAHALPPGSPASGLLEEVGKNAQRAADLVQQILAYAGKGRFVIQAVDLSGLVREMGALLRAAVSIGTEMGYDLAPTLPPVEADATQLRQVVMNLVTNASEAVAGGGGTVTVRTGSIPAAATPGGMDVFLEVSDTGVGMSADVIRKIFDPFFTTKFTGRGLGLAVVQGIARGHGGSLQVRSEPGNGSTFRLVLPCSTRTAAIPVAAPPPVEGWRGVGTALVIDDEKMVRHLVTRVLEQAGLTVLAAEDGQEGLELFREHGQGIDVAVVDLTMPGMGGIEVVGALRGLRPDLPFVLTSGFSAAEVAPQSAEFGIAGFLQKPFSTAALLAAVRRALGQ